MDYQAVASPTNYGAPQVFGQQGQPAAQAKAKQLLSSGQISSDQYTSLTQQLSTMGGNMGAGMPGAPQAGAPMNITPPGVGG